MQYSLGYDAEMCAWVARSDDGKCYSDKDPQPAQQWLAAQIRNDETDEERAELERIREAAKSK